MYSIWYKKRIDGEDTCFAFNYFNLDEAKYIAQNLRYDWPVSWVELTDDRNTKYCWEKTWNK